MTRLRSGTAGTSVLDAIIGLADPAARLLFAGDDQPRVVLDRALAVLRVNAALDRLLGMAAADRATLAELFAAEAGAVVVRAAANAIARAAAPPAPLVAQCRHADGGSVDVLVTITPVSEADGAASGAVLTLNPTGGLAKAGDIHARKLQAVGELAGGIAHDFNNLLQAVIGAAESLSERPLADAAREEVALILDGARRGAALVRQLLAFSAQQTLQPRIVAVNHAIAELAPLLRRSLGERVRLDLALEEPGRHVRIDPGQLDQVLVNLAVNAREAMPQGGTLTVRTGRLTVLTPNAGGLATVPPGRYVVIAVQDTGTGIPAELLGRIFEPFFTTRPSTGTGLGLSTVLGIVQQSGGFLDVASTPGQGTSFRILLPRSQPAASTTPEPVAADTTAPERAAHHRGTVLLVEDEAAVRRLAQRALERQGWQVLAAETGEAALALLASGVEPVCIVTDMVMPGIDGAALVQAVRARLARPALPAIIVSGYAEVPLHDAINAAATAFLPKPYALRDLTARVAALASAMPQEVS